MNSEQCTVNSEEVNSEKVNSEKVSTWAVSSTAYGVTLLTRPLYVMDTCRTCGNCVSTDVTKLCTFMYTCVAGSRKKSRKQKEVEGCECSSR